MEVRMVWVQGPPSIWFHCVCVCVCGGGGGGGGGGRGGRGVVRKIIISLRECVCRDNLR